MERSFRTCLIPPPPPPPPERRVAATSRRRDDSSIRTRCARAPGAGGAPHRRSSLRAVRRHRLHHPVDAEPGKPAYRGNRGHPHRRHLREQRGHLPLHLEHHHIRPLGDPPVVQLPAETAPSCTCNGTARTSTPPPLSPSPSLPPPRTTTPRSPPARWRSARRAGSTSRRRPSPSPKAAAPEPTRSSWKAPPTGNVTLTVTSDNAAVTVDSDATPLTRTLTFTTMNWGHRADRHGHAGGRQLRYRGRGGAGDQRRHRRGLLVEHHRGPHCARHGRRRRRRDRHRLRRRRRPAHRDRQPGQAERRALGPRRRRHCVFRQRHDLRRRLPRRRRPAWAVRTAAIPTRPATARATS